MYTLTIAFKGRHGVKNICLHFLSYFLKFQTALRVGNVMNFARLAVEMSAVLYFVWLFFWKEDIFVINASNSEEGRRERQQDE